MSFSLQTAENSLCNRGAKWTQEEEDRMMQSIQRGHSIYAIAVEHQRTYSAIKARLVQVALRMLEDGCPQDQVCNQLHISKGDIEQFVYQKTVSKDTHAQKAPPTEGLQKQNAERDLKRQRKGFDTSLDPSVCTSHQVLVNLLLDIKSKLVHLEGEIMDLKRRFS